MRRISETVQHEAFTGMGEDPKGNEIESWAAPVSLGIYAMSPGTTGDVEIDGHMHRVDSAPIIYVPSTAVVGNRDRITARGKRFYVDGDPADFRNPYDSSMNGIAIKLKAVTG